METGKGEYGVAPLDLGLTRTLAGFIAGLSFEALPVPLVHEARRGVMDMIGCALAARHHPTIAILRETFAATGSAPVARLLGHGGLRLGLLDAPVVNGQMGHLLDFDDTHMGGVVLHTSSPLLAALLALVEHRRVSGRALIVAYVAGFEAGVRAGQAAPAHHDGGWHLTGTLGAIAAGAGAARLLGLDAARTTHAIGIATTQAAGMQQNRGTMCKSFHAGKAGASGVLAALLAARGFNSSDEILEGRRGFARIYSSLAAPERITEGLGERFELTRNGYKPYACGIVLHPLIDAMIALRASAGLPAEAVAQVDLQVHPHAVKITGVDDPKSGLMSKFSINHSAAIAYLDGTAGIAQYSDGRATAPDVLAFRPKVRVSTVESFGKDQAHATLIATDGQRFEAPVAHASGTVANPMSDAALERKFLGNAAGLGDAAARRLADAIWALDRMEDAAELLALAA
jgi:2-methylcitrate dehydratase PrpD